MRLRGDAAGAAMLLRKGMEEAIKYDYENPLRYYELIALLADTGDEEAYKKYCRAMLTQFSNSQDIVVAERTAKACLLLPLGAAELEAASRLASFSVTQADPSSKDLAYFELVNGLACYRLGQHSVAIGWIDKCLAHGQVWSRQFDASREVAAYAVRAMAFAQLEQRREAQADLTQAGAILKTDAPNESFPSAATLGIDWTICNVLLREASKLIVQ